MADSSSPRAIIAIEDSDGDTEDGEYNPPRRTTRATRRGRSTNSRSRARRRRTSPFVRSPNPDNTQDSESNEDLERDSARGNSSEGEQSTHKEDLGVFRCPICMEVWASTGDHRVCCLPCGHLYGRSCISRWIDQCGRNAGLCPQCKKKCRIKDIRNIYAQKIAVADEELQQELLSLRSENECLKLEKKNLHEEVFQLKNANGRAMSLEGAKKHANDKVEPCQVTTQIGDHSRSESTARIWTASGCHFSLQNELVMSGARAFDLGAFNQIMVFSSKSSDTKHDHLLTKLSLSVPSDQESLHIPSNCGAIRDLHISPPTVDCPGRLVLSATLGKKLLVISLENNNTVLTYNLQAPAWSCAWDPNKSNYVYAGLQNGLLQIFDLRHMMHPVQVIHGLSSHPVHTVHSITSTQFHDEEGLGIQQLLSASAIGPCMWDLGLPPRSRIVLGLEDQGVCISIASCSMRSSILASFRPKVSITDDTLNSQHSSSPATPVSGPPKMGRHFLIKKTANGVYSVDRSFLADVSASRFTKSAIIALDNNKSFFTYGDEMTCSLGVWDMECLHFVTFLKQHQYPILDVKYAPSGDRSLLGCISESMFQLYTCY